MATFERFEDIDAWRDARELVKMLYQITSQGQISRDFGLRDQIRRAAVSVMSCIAEGFEHGNNREFRRFLRIAKASAGEVRSLLYVAMDAGYIDSASFDALIAQITTISRKIAGLIRYLGT